MNKSFYILILVVLSNFFSQILFKEISNFIVLTNISFESLYNLAILLIEMPVFWLAFFTFLLSATLWVIALKKVALSVAFSVMSLIYIFITFYSYFILKEEISIKNIISVFLIILGVLLIANNKKLNEKIKVKK